MPPIPRAPRTPRAATTRRPADDGLGRGLGSVRLRDDVRAEGFTHRLQQRVTLTPAQVLVIDFDGERGGIVLQ